MAHVTYDGAAVSLPDDNFVVVACRWSEAVEAVADLLASQDGTLRLHAARRQADKIVEVLSAIPLGGA